MSILSLLCCPPSPLYIYLGVTRPRRRCNLPFLFFFAPSQLRTPWGEALRPPPNPPPAKTFYPLLLGFPSSPVFFLISILFFFWSSIFFFDPYLFFFWVVTRANGAHLPGSMNVRITQWSYFMMACPRSAGVLERWMMLPNDKLDLNGLERLAQAASAFWRHHARGRFWPIHSWSLLAFNISLEY